MPQVPVVGDHEEGGGAVGAVDQADVLDHRQDHAVGGPTAAVADDDAGRDPLVAQATLGRAVEHELDRDRRRDRATKPADQRRRRRRTRPAGRLRDGVEEVGPIDQEPSGGGERVAVGLRHRRHRTRRGPPGYDRSMGLLLLVDLDGVVYRGADPVPGVAAVLADRAARGDDIVYVTNNSMHYRADYQSRLAAMGAPVSPNTVVSSARATAAYLQEHDPAIRRVLVLGAGGLERELRDVGYDVVTAGAAATRMSQEGIDGFAAAGRPDAVVVGLDPNLTYARLVVANDSIRAGAHFIATNRDPVYPTERGLRPGAGSLVIALEAATGVVPVSIGKPAPYLLEAAAHAVGRQPGEAIMIGDGIATDLAGARAVGARCVFMLTGVTTRAEVEALPADEQPIAIAANAAELAAALERLAEG